MEIDDAHLPIGYESGTLFHPTFLYEVLWNLALCGVLILIDKRMKLRPGRLLAVYVAGYFTGRFWIEGLRIDPANSGGGLRLNQWVSLFVVAAAVLYLVIDRQLHLHDEPVVDPTLDDQVDGADSAPVDELTTETPVSADEESGEYVPQDE